MSRLRQPADIPVFKGTRYPVQLNMKMARAMGIAIPPSILVQATRVRE